MNTNIPHFVSEPPSETELETARLLAQGKKVKQIAAARNLASHTVKTHTRDLRFKFEVDSTPRLLNRMQILKYIPHQLNYTDFPDHWHKYIRA